MSADKKITYVVIQANNKTYTISSNSKCYKLLFESSEKDREKNRLQAEGLLRFAEEAAACFYQVDKIASLRKKYSDYV